MERQNDTQQKVFSGLFWRFLERGGSQIVTLLVTIILQRLLEPTMYGTVSKVTVITAILLVFVDSGMANALIQKKDPDDLDFSSVFYFNIFFCLLLYLALFLLSPWLSAVFREPGLTPVLRVLGLTLIVAGLKNVQEAYVKKTMQFKRFFFATLGGTLFSGALGIVLALRGFGVWALVAQQLSNAAVNTAILWLTIPWRPKRMFSWRRLRGLLSYGWKLLVASLIDQGYQKIYLIITGILQGNAEMAFFEKPADGQRKYHHGQRVAPGTFCRTGTEGTAPEHDPASNPDREFCHYASAGGLCGLCNASGSVAGDRKVAADGAVSAYLLRHLCFLPHAPGEPECHQGFGPQ